MTHTIINREQLRALVQRERQAYRDAHPQSYAAFHSADHLFGRVPMTWMSKWSGSFPIYLQSARGSEVTCVDGHTYIDFALG
ncbi:MAG: aspartate aminotransferase family protein, partial [Actinobacteria bacterium]|nr:aspartate aminotransferase family protein [Actinomycetota bacterium]